MTAQATVKFNGARGYPTRAEFRATRPDTMQSETITVLSFVIP